MAIEEFQWLTEFSQKANKCFKLALKTDNLVRLWSTDESGHPTYVIDGIHLKVNVKDKWQLSRTLIDYKNETHNCLEKVFANLKLKSLQK